ncbi:chromosome partitioning protein [Priestia megaterium]|nr:chromosome partitioning protein [Priestia megaterium]
MKKLKTYMVIGFSAYSIIGCSNNVSPELEVYKALEKVAEQEMQFSKQQEPLTELEEQENVLYNEIISLGMKEKDSIDVKATEALRVLSEREVHLKNEKVSIDKSEKQFNRAKEKMNLLEEGKLKSNASKLAGLMEDRYQAYDVLYNSYIKSIELDRKLYTMLQGESVKLSDLEAQISLINKMYAQVKEHNEQFNELTIEYNNEKTKFYDETGLKVDSKNKES